MGKNQYPAPRLHALYRSLTLYTYRLLKAGHKGEPSTEIPPLPLPRATGEPKGIRVKG